MDDRPLPDQSNSPDWLLRLRDVTYQYPNGPAVLGGFDLELRTGEVAALTGPSGCGKSTLLHAIARLLPANGHISWNNQFAGDSRRPLFTMCFQTDTLLPWLTVRDNVGFGLRHLGLTKKERNDRVSELLAIADLADFAGSYPRQLSGGMRRRVGLMTSVAPRPHLLLLDEPFSALDEPTRITIHEYLLEIMRRFEIAGLLVTHDIAEAITLADQVHVLTHRPATIASSVAIGFGRDRDLKLVRTTETYQQLYRDVWSLLWKQIQAI